MAVKRKLSGEKLTGLSFIQFICGLDQVFKRSAFVVNIEDEVWPTTSIQKVKGGRKDFQSVFPIMDLCVGESMCHFLFDGEMSLPWGLLGLYLFQQLKLPCH